MKARIYGTSREERGLGEKGRGCLQGASEGGRKWRLEEEVETAEAAADMPRLTFTGSKAAVVTGGAVGNTVAPQEQGAGVLTPQTDAAVLVRVRYTALAAFMAAWGGGGGREKRNWAPMDQRHCQEAHWEKAPPGM